MEFTETLRARRSCRKYTADKVPGSVIEKALDDALIAPNSSNMQLWQFYWVSSPEKKSALAHACFGQSAASTAQEMVVIVADWSLWKENRKRMLEILRSNNANKGVLAYYEKLVPMAYTYGPLSLIGYIKKITMWAIGWFRPVPRGPNTRSDVAMVAVKSAALACENFMLSICDQGYACCPMEGFDEKLVNKVIGNKTCASKVTMVISVGNADPQGIYGPQIRFDKSLFIKKL
jgi:nitroreductase